MNVANRQKSVVITIDEENQYPLSFFSIYRYSNKNCLIPEPVLSGQADEYGRINISLEDGRYNIVVVGESDKPDIEQCFSVYYNYLPIVLKNAKNVLCDSHSCVECNSNTNIFESFYETIMFLNSTGILNQLVLVPNLLNKQFTKLSIEREYEKFYGEFKYSFNYSIKRFFAYLCAELYYREFNILRYEDYKESDVKNMFSIGVISKCMHENDMDLNDILCKIPTLNCGCDE